MADQMQVLRQNLYLSNSDDEKLGLYKGAVNLLRELPSGSFPPKEVSWLVTTCFNRGCQHAKFCRSTSAVAFMDAAIILLEFCPDLQAKRAVCFSVCLPLSPVNHYTGCQKGTASCRAWAAFGKELLILRMSLKVWSMGTRKRHKIHRTSAQNVICRT